MLKFQNTLTGQLEEFRPMREGEVRMYNCGPTVWDFAHIGNFRTSIFVDILRRYLIFKGFRVTHVTNITDVDDRIIQMAGQKNVTLDEYTAPYVEAFWEDFDALGCQRPEIAPRATHHIPEMEAIVRSLMERGCAYETEGSYYFRITSFPGYGKLSKINFAGNIAGASERVDTDKYEKEDARDFVLWKAQKSVDEPSWETEIGRGRPGWHIECSAMSMKYLGETFDIHCGGVDLIFPHHENEIAQSEGATGKPFVNYWLHGEHLKINGESMSKSKGNYYTFRDLTRQGFSPAAIRYALFSAPYRKQINFTLDNLRGTKRPSPVCRRFARGSKKRAPKRAATRRCEQSPHAPSKSSPPDSTTISTLRSRSPPSIISRAKSTPRSTVTNFAPTISAISLRSSRASTPCSTSSARPSARCSMLKSRR
jgi:cysteinyl-tRNA synthetase